MQPFQWHGNGPFGLIQPRHRPGKRCWADFENDGAGAGTCAWSPKTASVCVRFSR